MAVSIVNLLFWLLATILLVVVSVSAPTWNSVYFFRASNGEMTYHFGVFGYTGSRTHLGYFSPISIGHSASDTLHSLTVAFILHPIAAALFGMAIFIRVCTEENYRMVIMLQILCLLAAVIACIASFVGALFIGIARHEFQKLGWSIHLGSVFPLTLIATIIISRVAKTTFGSN